MKTDDTDNLSTKELEEMRWNGLRHNFLAGRLELWVCGQIRKELSMEDAKRDPGLIATMFEEVFGLEAHIIITNMPNQKPKGFTSH